MKRTPVAVVALVSMLLLSCQSKREICAQFAADRDYEKASNKLGIDFSWVPGHWKDKKTENAEKYCEYYKS